MNELLGLGALLLVALPLAVGVAAAAIARDAVRPPRHTAGWAMARGVPADPGELGLEHESWTLDRPGAALPVWEIGRGGRAAVFVHGWGESRADVLSRIGDWTGLVDRLVLYDLRGHGDASAASRLGDGEDADLLALIDALGEAPVIVVGWGLGAVIAAQAARRGRDRIAGVVACAAYDDFGEWLRGRLREASLPARPLVGCALALLRLRGLRPPGARGPLELECPHLSVPSLPGPEALGEFVERCYGPRESASMSGAR